MLKQIIVCFHCSFLYCDTLSAFNTDEADITKFHHGETVANGLKLRKNILD